MPSSYTPSDKQTSIRIPLDASRLRQARQRKNLTLEEVTALVSINKMTLLRYETGDIRAIAPERMERLAALYETTQAWLSGISSTQEFISDTGLEITPISADPPTPLGRRLNACVTLAKRIPAHPAADDHYEASSQVPGAGS